MSTFLIIVTKYLFILLMFFYVWECFSALRCKNPYKASGIFQRQNGIIFLTYFLGIATIYLNQQDTTDIGVIVLGGAQLCYLIVVLGIFPIIYPNINKAILSNMCMLLTIGFIILARLRFQNSIKQFIIVAIVSMASLVVPYLMSKYEMWKSFTWIYCLVGIGLLSSVLILGQETGGANLSIKIGGFAFQPSEFVKIIFVFFIAGLLSRSAEFKNIVLSAVMAGIHVLILVASRDLGSALIFFMVYVFMVYIGTRKARYIFICFGGLSLASILAYRLFAHVRVRVSVWMDPWADPRDTGYQITQSLFALGNGGLTGTGLYQGQPKDIPVVDQDFIFSAIGEEFGAIFAILLIVVCLTCFIAFLNTAMQQISLFNKLVCVGLGIQYAVQIIVTVGGAINMIPSTGVTFPLLSYGGSSILSTLIVFAIIQGLAIVGTTKHQAKRKVPRKGAKHVKERNTQEIRIVENTQEIKIR
ncbi:MAG: FtsW/RodA/SpoVE family cell cycle protein [Eubacterium sp.]|nr:FtsW/RodA/SpoVE family cell cycle protein [Eubacterium sp.]